MAKSLGGLDVVKAGWAVGEAVVRRLRPFLFDEREIRKVKLLGEVLKQLE